MLKRSSSASQTTLERLRVPAAVACASLSLIFSFVFVFATTGHVISATLCFFGTLAVLPMVLIPFFTTKTFDAFHPLHMVGLSVFCGATGRAFYVVYSDSDRHVSFLLDERPLETVLTGAIIVAIGIICLGFGFLAARNMRFPIERTRFAKISFGSGRMKVLAILFCVITGIVTFDFMLKTGFSGFSSLADLSHKRKAEVSGPNANLHIAALGYHKLIGTILPRITCFFLISLLLIKGNRGLLPFAILTGLASCVMPFFSSSRIEIIFLILTILIIINCRRRIAIPQLAIGTVCILTVLVGMKALRQGDKFEGDRNVVESSIDAVFGSRNFCGITKTAHLYEGVPSKIEMKQGQTLLLWIYAPIPRTLWPQKPSISLGYEITERIYDRNIYRGGGTPPGFIGEMILNFGFVGVPIGCFLVGGILSVFYSTFQPVVQTNAVLRCMYAGLLIPLAFHLITGEVSRTMIGVLTFLGLFVLLAFLFRTNEK